MELSISRDDSGRLVLVAQWPNLTGAIKAECYGELAAEILRLATIMDRKVSRQLKPESGTGYRVIVQKGNGANDSHCRDR